ncbi:MAG: TonB-dependent receptor [Bacteroidota bacterium]
MKGGSWWFFRFFFILSLSSLALNALAQEIRVDGQILDLDTNEPVSFASVYIKNSQIGTTTDESGFFYLISNRHEIPLVLIISATGYLDVEYNVTSNDMNIKVRLQKGQKLISNRTVSSASRSLERAVESPVSVEILDLRNIQHGAFASAYEGMERLRGIQMNGSSFYYKSANARGFADFNNTRFVQIVDGIDNAPSGLNFNLGNVFGISELDLESIELIPGPASALYGPNAFNGIVFLNSKTPYEHPGLSVMMKAGFNNQEIIGSNVFTDLAIRYANTVGTDKKLGYEINAAFFQGTDWWATDLTDSDTNPLNLGVTGPDNPSYNGINVYGDEIAQTINVNQIITELTGQNLGFGPIHVSRTGYEERDLVDYTSSSLKLDGSLFYKLNNNTTFSGTYRYLQGDVIHQATNRIAFRDIGLQQAKVELASKDYQIKGYYTQNNGGNTYDTRYLAWNINRAWKSDLDWFSEYTTVYLERLLGLDGRPAAQDPADAHTEARAFADRDRLTPGTAEFVQTRDSIQAIADLSQGARLIEKSSLFHAEGFYNFNSMIPFLELQVGGSTRQYTLNSEGTVFNDGTGPISIFEYGAYVQAGKRLFDQLKLTASVRYDKNQNFDGLITPRASAVLSLGKDRNHNLRASYQTGFRNPDALGQYLALDLGVVTSIGTAQDNIDNLAFQATYLDQTANLQTVTITGTDVLNNSYTAESAQDFGNAVSISIAQGLSEAEAAIQNLDRLEVADYQVAEPERIQTFEVGYKGLIENTLLLDISAYYNRYENFNRFASVTTIVDGDVNDLVSFSGASALLNNQFRNFQLTTISDGVITSRGFGLSLNYAFLESFSLGGHYQFTDAQVEEGSDPSNFPGINTPKHRLNLFFANYKVGRTNFGFMFNFRWLDRYFWADPFWTGEIEAHSVIDGQISYTLPDINMTFRLGANNLLNRPYRNAVGAPMQGSVYYIALIFNNLK